MDIYDDIAERQERRDIDYASSVDVKHAGSVEVQLRIKKNQIEMLKTRGYIPEKKYKHIENMYMTMTPQKLINRIQTGELRKKKKTVKEEMSVVYEKKNRHGFGTKVLVKFLEFPQDKKTGKPKKEPKETLTNVMREISGTDIKHVIMISLFGLSSNVETEIKKLSQIRFETFTLGEMTFNPIKHVMAPEYKLLSSDKWNDIKETNDLEESKIPRALTTGRIARYYGAMAGDAFEFKYKTSIPTVAFTSKYSHIEYRVVRKELE